MGYASNVCLSIPTAIIMYLLINKLILQFILNNNYNNTQQKSFVLEFIFGLLFIIIAITVFTHIPPAIKYTFYLTGGFMIINSGIFNWDTLDEYTKIIFLTILFSGCVIYSYKNM